MYSMARSENSAWSAMDEPYTGPAPTHAPPGPGAAARILARSRYPASPPQLPDRPLAYAYPKGWAGGRRSDHGAAASTWAATRNNSPSSQGPATNCTPTGSPEAAVCRGRLTAG